MKFLPLLTLGVSALPVINVYFGDSYHSSGPFNTSDTLTLIFGRDGNGLPRPSPIRGRFGSVFVCILYNNQSQVGEGLSFGCV